MSVLVLTALLVILVDISHGTALQELAADDVEIALSKRAVPRFCNLPMAPGPCRLHAPMFFYDAASGECKSFVYGGCQGNKNRFGTKEECEKKCIERGQKRIDICNLPKVIGPCKALAMVYHFDAESGECKEFGYGGCGGNKNNFPSKNACEKFCIRG